MALRRGAAPSRPQEHPLPCASCSGQAGSGTVQGPALPLPPSRFQGDELACLTTVSQCLPILFPQGFPSPWLRHHHPATPHPTAHLFQDRYGPAVADRARQRG